MILFLILTALIAGPLAALAMSSSMKGMSRLGGGDEVDMVLAIGSFFTRKKEGGTRAGIRIHLGSGVFFGAIYGLIFSLTGIVELPQVFLIGLGAGFIHGIGMAYVLMIFMAEKHPLPEFRSVSLVIGAVHLAGHVVFGGCLGLLAGIISAVIRTS